MQQPEDNLRVKEPLCILHTGDFVRGTLQEKVPQGRKGLGGTFRSDLEGKLAEREKEHIERLEQEIPARA